MPGPNPQQIFQGGGQPEPDQLLIHSGRIFAVAEQRQGGAHFLDRHGRSLGVSGSATERSTISGVFPTDSTSPNVRLRISGNYLYVFSPRNLIAYRIDPPTENWERISIATTVHELSACVIRQGLSGPGGSAEAAVVGGQSTGEQADAEFFHPFGSEAAA